MCIPVDCGWAGKSIELHYYALHARVPRCTPVSIQFTNWLDPLAKILFAAHCLDFFCEIFATKSEWHWDNFYKEMKISGFSPICHFQSGAFFLKLQMSQDGRLWKDCDSKELRLACNLADTFPWAGDVKTAVVYEVEPGEGLQGWQGGVADLQFQRHHQKLWLHQMLNVLSMYPSSKAPNMDWITFSILIFHQVLE